MKPHFPLKLSREFLLIDLVDNLDRLAEHKPSMLERVKKQPQHADHKALKKAVREYGGSKVRKFFEPLLPQGSMSHAT